MVTLKVSDTPPTVNTKSCFCSDCFLEGCSTVTGVPILDATPGVDLYASPLMEYSPPAEMLIGANKVYPQYNYPTRIY